jgi:uncharacterized protein YndB with AHSA1/START domain
MPDKYARLEENDGRPALRFERALPHPPERVWKALTDTREMFAWHPTPAEFEPRVGGRVLWDPDGHVADMPENEVTDWDPPRLLGYTWAKEGDRPDHLLWEVRPDDDGCVLVLTHTFDDRLKAARDGAGWHTSTAGASGRAPSTRPGPGPPSTTSTRAASVSPPRRRPHPRSASGGPGSAGGAPARPG